MGLAFLLHVQKSLVQKLELLVRILTNTLVVAKTINTKKVLKISTPIHTYALCSNHVAVPNLEAALCLLPQRIAKCLFKKLCSVYKLEDLS